MGGGMAAPAGAEIDDDPGTAVDHGGQEMAEDMGGAFDVHIDDGIEFLHGDVPERGVVSDDSGIVDDQVGWSETGEEVAGPDTDGGVVGDIDDIETVEGAV